MSGESSKKALRGSSETQLALADAPASVAPAGSGASTGSKKQRERDADLQAMDKEMRQVAELHQADKATNSAKSLVSLIPANFMDAGRSHALGHTLVAATRPTICERFRPHQCTT